MSYRREVDYVIQESAVVWRDVDVVSEVNYADSSTAMTETLVRLDQFRKRHPRLHYRAIVRVVEEFPILLNV